MYLMYSSFQGQLAATLSPRQLARLAIGFGQGQVTSLHGWATGGGFLPVADNKLAMPCDKMLGFFNGSENTELRRHRSTTVIQRFVAHGLATKDSPMDLWWI